MDFNNKTYLDFISTLLKRGISFSSLGDQIEGSLNNTITLRHDVDRLPLNSLKFAQIQSTLGLKGLYFFRIVPESYDEKIISKLAELGHEVGYHYEDLSLARANLKANGTLLRRGFGGQAGQRAKGKDREKMIADEGIESFAENLERLRRLVPVKTICMHGSPMSKWDSRLLWKYYNYRDFGIEVEPYFDVDFREMLYLTDTGRSWSGDAVSIRDKAKGMGHGAWADPYQEWVRKPIPGSLMYMTEEGIDFQNRYKYKTTNDIIRAAEKGELPDKIMMTFHPQRWTDKPLPWIKELVWQNVKNVGKYFLIKMRD